MASLVARAPYFQRYAMRFEKRTLGRSGFSVAPLGLASGYGTDEAMVEEAVDHGVNYLYWGAWRSKRMAEGIKKVSKANRNGLIIVCRHHPLLSIAIGSCSHSLGYMWRSVARIVWNSLRKTFKSGTGTYGGAENGTYAPHRRSCL